MTSKGTNERRTQTQIAEVARVTEVTLRTRAKQIKSHLRWAHWSQDPLLFCSSKIFLKTSSPNTKFFWWISFSTHYWQEDYDIGEGDNKNGGFIEILDCSITNQEFFEADRGVTNEKSSQCLPDIIYAWTIIKSPVHTLLKILVEYFMLMACYLKNQHCHSEHGSGPSFVEFVTPTPEISEQVVTKEARIWQIFLLIRFCQKDPQAEQDRQN